MCFDLDFGTSYNSCQILVLYLQLSNFSVLGKQELDTWLHQTHNNIKYDKLEKIQTCSSQ